MNYKNLNKVIDYIEMNLQYEISYKKISKMVGLSEYTIQRIFVFLTNITLSEYIKRRRLSKALEELKNSNTKIIEIAIKYNYNSSISFSRAFKQYFGVTPSECRKDNKKYKIFPVIKFDDKKSIYDEVNYEIKKFDTKVIYCYEVEAIRHDDFLYKIRKLYEKYDNKISKSNRYGIYIKEDEKYKYLLGTKEKKQMQKKVIIEGGNYAIFNVKNRNQEEIVNVYNFIYNEWLSSTCYKLRLDVFEFEYYDDDNCYICVPIR